MDIKIKRFLLTGFIVALGAASVDLNAMKRRADQPAEDVLQGVNQEQQNGQQQLQRQAVAYQPLVVTYKRRKTVAYKRAGSWYYAGGRWHDHIIDPAKHAALIVMLNQAYGQQVAQDAQNLIDHGGAQAVVANNANAIEKIQADHKELASIIEKNNEKLTELQRNKEQNESEIKRLSAQNEDLKNELSRATNVLDKMCRDVDAQKKAFEAQQQKTIDLETKLITLTTDVTLQQQTQKDQLKTLINSTAQALNTADEKQSQSLIAIDKKHTQESHSIRSKIKWTCFTFGAVALVLVAGVGVLYYLTWKELAVCGVGMVTEKVVEKIVKDRVAQEVSQQVATAVATKAPALISVAVTEQVAQQVPNLVDQAVNLPALPGTVESTSHTIKNVLCTIFKKLAFWRSYGPCLH